MIDSTSTAKPPPAPAPARLGEELPVFCERCGYSLHGLPPVRCGHCDILHHRCPECGHTQPINTLRPAFQRMLGRLRAAGLALIVLFKINFFAWLLVAWGAMGSEWSYQIHSRSAAPRITMASSVRPVVQQRSTYDAIARPLDLESILAFSIFATAFGLVGRMLLLRWRASHWVGLILAVFVALSIIAGAYLRQRELLARSNTMSWGPVTVESPFTASFAAMVALTMLCILGGAVVVWPIWSGLVRLFLPTQTASALLAWQRGLSAPVSGLARE